LWILWESNPNILFAKETTCLRYQTRVKQKNPEIFCLRVFLINYLNNYKTPRDIAIPRTAAHLEQMINEIVCTKFFITLFFLIVLQIYK
jgi:hypothetical protein